MAIKVTCPGCHKRFEVGDKYAGQRGPCPNCKATIEVPKKSDEVVVHEAEFGPTDAAGKAILKPITRSETSLTPVTGVAIGGGVLLVLLVAWLFRSPEGDVPRAIPVLGTILLAPPLVLAGYVFLRDDELEPYQGQELMIRVGICSLLYALIWGIYAWLPGYLEIDQWSFHHLIFVAPPLVLLGGVIAMLCFELEYFTSLIHYGFYLMTTLILALILNVPLVSFSG